MNFKPEEVTAIELFKTQYTGSMEKLESTLERLIDKIIMCSKAIQKGYMYFFMASIGEKNKEFMDLINDNGFIVEPTSDKFIMRVWITANLDNMCG